jgi:hypothetical protein
MEKEEIDTASGSTSSAAHRRPRATIPPILIAEGWLLRVSLRPLFFNLKARAQLGRPSYNFSAACNIDSDPSGLIPGVRKDGRASRLLFELGGEGIDGVLFFISRVLFAFLEDLVVILLLVVVLLVSCVSPPTISNAVSPGPSGRLFVQKKSEGVDTMHGANTKHSK